MAADKPVKMIAITRVGLGDRKVAPPDEEFAVAEAEAERLERVGAARRVEEPKKEAKGAAK